MKQIIICGGDFLIYTSTLVLALLIRNWQIPDLYLITINLSLFFVIHLLWLIVNYISGLYDLTRQLKEKKYIKSSLQTALLSLVVSVLFIYIFPNNSLTPKTILLINIILGYSGSILWRYIYEKFINEHTPVDKILFVGFEPEIAELHEIIKKSKNTGYQIIGLVDGIYKTNTTDLPVCQDYNLIKQIINEDKINIVVISSKLRKDETANKILYSLLFEQVRIIDLPKFYETITGRITPSTFSESWFLENLKKGEGPTFHHIKVFFDILAASFLSIFFLISFPFIALAVKLNSKGPIFIKQKRIGLGGKVFTLIKYRSMYALSSDGSAEINGVQFAVKNDKRITTIGKFLRKMRIDELPQVINLWKGEVTLVGPRPERPEIVKELEARMPYYSLRHVVKPGLTGWALINQNYTDNYDTSLEKLQYDLYYIKNQSLLLDISIILKTLNVIIKLQGQ